MDAYLQFQKDLHEISKNCGDRIAITYIKKNGTLEELSYIQMKEKVLERAKTYESRGIRRGDRIAVLIPICPDAYLSILTLAYMGVTSVILDCNLHKEELGRLLEDADVSGIITTYSLFETKMAEVKVAAYSESSQALAWNHEELHHPSDPDYEAIAILYSSGTTSNAKGVVIGYEQEMRAMDRLLEVVGTTDIRYLMMFPNSHVSGFTDALVLLLRGGTLATMEESTATQLVKGFQIYKPNTFGMVPKVWETFKGKIEDGIRAKGKIQSKVLFGLVSLCGKLRKTTGINLGRKLFASINQEVFGGNLQNIHTGGGKANPEANEFFWNLGFDVYDFYASTEANIPIMVAKSTDQPLAGMGKPTALKGIDIRIQNPDATGVGEIQVKSDTMMRGYFRNPELTTDAYEDGYFKTGDYGKLENGEIFITGRIKDSIFLKNGEKVSPDDIEAMYRKYLPEEIDFSVAGVADDQGYSHVEVFVAGVKGQYDQLFRKINKQMSENYRFKELTYVESLPKTSVGKVKRYLLIKETGSKDGENIRLREKFSLEILQEILLSQASSNVNTGDGSIENLTMNDRLAEDLGMGSLAFFEIVSELESRYHVELAYELDGIKTVGDLFALVENKLDSDVTDSKRRGQQEYPAPRSRWLLFQYRMWIRLMHVFYRIKIQGKENIPEEHVILCSNHFNYFDPFWLLAGLDLKKCDMNDFVCAVAQERFEEKQSRYYIQLLGGIPVNRTGNTIPAMQRLITCASEGKNVILFPEGARSRDGGMLLIKSGVGKIALESGTNILPIRIDGGFEIWPRHKNLPSLFNWKRMRRHKLTVTYKPVIQVEGNSEEEIMKHLIQAISK
ncbi:MAG: AMP-binding protein [Lachnospiraceae bacterium]|nr:AMP-binding protein [Lachnospiraceae bacterium]